MGGGGAGVAKNLLRPRQASERDRAPEEEKTPSECGARANSHKVEEGDERSLMNKKRARSGDEEERAHEASCFS